MARLRVGDIDIDGRNVRIGASVDTRTPDGPTSYAVAPPPGMERQGVDAIPGSPAWWVALGGLSVTVGILLILFTSGPLDIEHALTRGAFTVPLGVGMLLLGGMKWLARRGVAPFAPRLEPDPVTRARLVELRRALEQPRRHTVDSLNRQLGWSELDVVRALGWLRMRDEIDEEVDPDSGQFHYVFTPRPIDLETRLRHLGSGA